MANAALIRGLEVLRASGKFDEGQVTAFGRFVTEAPEESLFRMSPVTFAAANGTSERDAIDLFLHATHAGVLEFTWGLVCPGCKAFLSTPAALRALTKNQSCRLCQIEVAPGDDSVEVAFNVSPAVRKLRFHDAEQVEFKRDWTRVYFSPSNVFSPELARMCEENVAWSGSISAGGAASFEAELAVGSYGLVTPFQHVWSWVNVREDADTREADFDLLGAETLPLAASVAPGNVAVRLRNRSGGSLMVGLVQVPAYEQLKAGRKFQPYLSGKRLVTSQAFRDLFRSQSIPSGAGLEFKRLTVLFTDLKGSTDLYERVGDVRAFGLVRDHFDMLREVIDRSGGAMVKTIGDAIMASFADVEPAMAAATAMRTGISGVGQGELQLKVGLHAGPCIAVELNEQLDYFGQTVNVAARVQGLAEGGEIVCTEDVWSSPGVEAQARAAGLVGHRDRARLKGVSGEMTVYRLRAG